VNGVDPSGKDEPLFDGDDAFSDGEGSGPQPSLTPDPGPGTSDPGPALQPPDGTGIQPPTLPSLDSTVDEVVVMAQRTHMLQGIPLNLNAPFPAEQQFIVFPGGIVVPTQAIQTTTIH